MCWLKDAPFFFPGNTYVENTGKQGCQEDKPAGYYYKITSQVDDRVEFPLKARLIKLSLDPNKKLGFFFFLEWIFKIKKQYCQSCHAVSRNKSVSESRLRSITWSVAWPEMLSVKHLNIETGHRNSIVFVHFFPTGICCLIEPQPWNATRGFFWLR